jgi:hypothetical protein
VISGIAFSAENHCADLRSLVALLEVLTTDHLGPHQVRAQSRSGRARVPADMNALIGFHRCLMGGLVIGLSSIDNLEPGLPAEKTG